MSQVVSLGELPASAAETSRPVARSLPGIYIELTKARLSAMVVVTAAVGFLMASPATVDWALLGWTVLGTTLAAFGANALNQCREVERDRRMNRTRHRPLPSGQIGARHAWAVGLGCALAGPLLLALLVNPLTAALGLANVLIYVCLYTPLKVRHSANTLVGAICGAVPPMMGWAAATGGLAAGAWMLAILLFLWQIPHFLALAWMYREDYARGGFRMLPAVDPSGTLTFRLITLYSAGLLTLGPALALAGVTGWIFAAGALLLGLWLLGESLRLGRRRNEAQARRVFLTSVIYLPLVMALMAADRIPAGGLV